MKAILLAGGTGTRLRPLTGLMNKHMLPVYQYPMIHYAIHTLAEAGADEILLVTGRQSAGLFIDYLGSGEAFGARLTYLIQEQAGGIAQALDLAKPFIAPQEKFLMLLGDNLVEDSLKPYVEAYRGQEPGTAMVLLKEVPDPHRYGVPVFDSEEASPRSRKSRPTRRRATASPASTCTTAASSTSSPSRSLRDAASWRSPTSTTPTPGKASFATRCCRAGGPMRARSTRCTRRRAG